MTDEKPKGPYADVAPKLDEVTRDVLFGDVWKRPGLSPRDRSLVTVASLISVTGPPRFASRISSTGEASSTRSWATEPWG
jgi:alkylhydroperoxidase/carboxymuconolactone decarboxylase family protein YurZ